MYKPIDVDDYIAHHEDWSVELNALRKILLQSELEETIKWFIPTYTWNKKNLIGMGAFKDWVGIWFFQGSFLLDPYDVLVNAQEGKTKGLRQWRFKKGDKINPVQLMEYIVEAIENQKKGLEIKPERKAKQLKDIPQVLLKALQEDNLTYENWGKLTISRKNEYIDYITGAKREETKQKRLKESMHYITQGRPLSDKYRK